MTAKDESIETLRGIAIILIVAGYIIREDLHGMHSAMSSFMDHLYFILKPIRLPLFTVISGYLYAAAPVTRNTFKKLVAGKARRLLIPYFTVSTLQYVFFSFFQVQGPHPMREILKIYLWPFQQLWFLWAIFWIFVAVGMLDGRGALDTPRKWLGWLLLAVLLYLILSLPRFLAARGILYLLPCFLLGYGFRRFSRALFSRRMIVVYGISAVVSYTAYLQLDPGISYQAQPYKFFSVWVTLSVLPLIFCFRPHLPPLAWIGYHSFGIFLFNKMTTAPVRMAFQYFDIDNQAWMFLTYLTAGIFISIIINQFLERFNPVREFILGMKKRPQAAGEPEAAAIRTAALQ